MEKIFDCEVPVTTFYNANKDIINLKRKEFAKWIVDKNYFSHIRDKYIGTQWAKENGYIINKTRFIIDTSPVDIMVTFSGYLTPKGQQSIIDKRIKEKEAENDKQ